MSETHRDNDLLDHVDVDPESDVPQSPGTPVPQHDGLGNPLSSSAPSYLGLAKATLRAYGEPCAECERKQAEIVGLRVQVGEAMLVVEQQDRDLKRMKLELDALKGAMQEGA